MHTELVVHWSGKEHVFPILVINMGILKLSMEYLYHRNLKMIGIILLVVKLLIKLIINKINNFINIIMIINKLLIMLING